MEVERENRVRRLGGGRCYCTLDAGYTYNETEVTLVLLLIPVHNARGE